MDTPAQENNAQTVVANGERQNRDEIKAYLEGRYVSASETSWRLFSFRMHDGTPSVTRLAVHKPRMHTVVYNDNANIFEIVNSEQNQKTTLTEYFQANIDYPLAREVTYMDFPSMFTCPCLHGPMGRKNGPSGREGALSSAFILLVLLLANAIS